MVKIYLRNCMRITTIFLGISLLCSSLLLASHSSAQTVSLDMRRAHITDIFSALEKQAGVRFTYNEQTMKGLPNIDLKAVNRQFTDVLTDIEKLLPLKFKKTGTLIGVQRIENKVPPGSAQTERVPDKTNVADIRGIVTDEQGKPLPGASVRVKGSNISTTTDNNGNFTLRNVPSQSIIQVSFMGFGTQEQLVPSNGARMEIRLKEDESRLTEVSIVSTGYQEIPKERATGSFVQINSELYNRRVGTNVLDRLDGVTSGLIFNKMNSNGGGNPRNEKLGISIRGRSTIDEKVSADPLIVVDNFPFEGNIANLNPNDVESVTVLKDAAAASIWGARSGNGVIVITTKKGKFNQPLQIGFNSNVTIGQKPDLYYSRNYIDASTYIDGEIYMFGQGYYDANLANTTTYPLLSPVVELLAKKRAGTISAADADAQINSLRTIDTREESSRYFFQKSILQQYALNFTGGTEKTTYNFSAGYDDNRSSYYGFGYNRLNLNANNVYRPFKGLEITTGINYSKGNEIKGYTFSSAFPYLKFADANGNPSAVPFGYRTGYLQNMQSQGYLDWQLRPLQERDLTDNIVTTRNTIIRTSAKYTIAPFLNASLQYQYEYQDAASRIYQSQDQYDVRNQINRFAQKNTSGVMSYPFPLGGILTNENKSLHSNNFRGQLNFNRTFGAKHAVSALAGAEVRSIVSDSYSRVAYGYDDTFGTAVTNLNFNTTYPVNPTGLGSLTLPSINNNVTGTTNRYVSYYANASYTFMERYIVTTSGRKDGANIFGVRTNDKVTPLWSTGLAWNISKESFYKFSLLPNLKLRATYGYNGNVYNASAYLTAAYSTSSLTGAQYAQINSPPNAELRWEKIRNINLGLDFSSKGSILSGTIEFYQKNGTDLIQDALVAPSTGFFSYKGNSATLKTSGTDLTLHSNNLKGNFGWSTDLLLSLVRDKVTNFDTQYAASYLANFNNAASAASTGILPVVGNSLFGIYSYKWTGLDPANGDPLGYLDGAISKDYTSILSRTQISDLVYHGSGRPTTFGSIRNTLNYRNFSLSFNVTYKFGYYFRAKSTPINYAQIFTSNLVNADFNLRWQKPGDEATTSVPSVLYASNTNRNTFYQSSEVVVEKGDHIRLQDISISYDLKSGLLKKAPFSWLQVFGYLNNLGILWRANKKGLDPDYTDKFFYNLSFPDPRTVSLGLRGTF